MLSGSEKYLQYNNKGEYEYLESASSTTSVHKYMAPLIFFENFDHSSYSKYLFKKCKILSQAHTTLSDKKIKKISDNSLIF
jgi:hypothetical protein